MKNLVPILKACNARHIFLVRGKGSYISCGAEKIINSAVSEINCDVTEYCDFSENPKFDDLIKGIELLKRSNADIILAVGGGSVMDMAKLIRFFAAYEGEVTGKNFNKISDELPLIVLPTTAGTGAEATHFSVLYKDNVKYSVEHDSILPDYVLIYPPFTYGNNKYLTACTGFDALAQAIEAFWNVNATEESDAYAEKAIGLLWPNLPQLVNNPTESLRDKVSEGSYWAGKAINITKTTAPHAFSYPFTSFYGYPHGHAVALTFPYFFALNCGGLNSDRKRVVRLLQVLGIDQSADLSKHMKTYAERLGLQLREGEEIDKNLILSQVNLDRLKNNPVEIVDQIISDSILIPTSRRWSDNADYSIKVANKETN